MHRLVAWFLLLLSALSCGKDEELATPIVPNLSPGKTIKITFIGDDGMVITDGTKVVLVDALVTRFDLWKPAAAGLVNSIKIGETPYHDVSLNLVTHDHFDHWDQPTTRAFLSSHPQTNFICPPQVASQILGNNQVTAMNPATTEKGEAVIDGIRITGMRMVHFDNFGLDFSSIQNLAFIIEMGGKKILHLGDADITEKNFAPFNLVNENIDVVILPAANIKLTQQNLDIVKAFINPKNIIAAHVEFSTTERTVKNAWGDIVVFTKSLQFVEY